MTVRMNSIRIKKINVQKNRVDFYIDIPQGIKKYFLTDHLFFEYDKDISQVPLSILTIPAVANLISLCWALGINLHVKEIDFNFLKSLEKVRQIFNKWFPRFELKNETVTANKIPKNHFKNTRHTLLFTCGLDSLFSYVQNRDKNPILVTYWGADIFLSQKRKWNMVKKNIERFCAQEKKENHFIKTNMREIINGTKLSRQFKLRTWWGEVNHGLMLIGSLAPQVVRDSKMIIIGATHTHNFHFPWGSSPEIDEQLEIANIKIIHHGFSFSRLDKINTLSQHPEVLKFLKVCYSPSQKSNCGICEKCSRTIVGLILADINPNKCNFYFRKTDLINIKKCFEKRALKLHNTYWWKEIQDRIPKDIHKSHFYIPQFFNWLRGFNFSSYEQSSPYTQIDQLKKLIPIINLKNLFQIFMWKVKNYLVKK